jgi:uncharacterized protein
MRYAVFLTDSENLPRNEVWIRDYGVGPFRIKDVTENCYLLVMKNARWGWTQENFMIKNRFSVITGGPPIQKLVELEDLL